MTFYTSILPSALVQDFNFVAKKLTGKTILELNCIVDNRKWNYPHSSLPRGCACEFDAPDVGMSVLLMAHTAWDNEGWVQVLYLRPIGYEHAPWRFGSGANGIGKEEFVDDCVASATKLYQKPEYRKEWLKHSAVYKK